MQRILLTGTNGFVGWYLTEALIQKGYEVIATSRGANRQNLAHSKLQFQQLNFTDAIAVEAMFNHHRPMVVIHSGAISNPDECERNKTMAFTNNVDGTRNLLTAATKYQAHFIFLSTDFIFPGTDGMSSENNPPNPVNYYAQTKLEAEQLVQAYKYAWAIVRTVLVYGKAIPGRQTLVTTVADNLRQGKPVTLFTDQVRNPTYVGDLVNGISSIVQQGATGIYHLAGAERLSLYEAGLQIADVTGADRDLVKPIKDGDVPLLAARPKDGGLHIDKARRQLGYAPLPFAEGLRQTLD